MCLAMYLLTNEKIVETEWSEDHPGMWIQLANETKDRGSLQWADASRSTIYTIGSYTRCGCGWMVDEYAEPEESARKQADRRQLAQLLCALKEKRPWIIACWEGDQGKPLLPPITITTGEINDDAFEFEELRLYIFDQGI
jgi:hypothetical protein